MSASSALDVVAPAFHTCPDSFITLGPEVADLASAVGFPPDPEQRMLLDDMYAMSQDRTPVAFEFCVICSRQNLKTGVFKMAAIADAFYFHEPLTVWTAHLFDTTEGAFRDLKQLIDGSDMLTRRVKKITEGHGDEEIVLTDGCLIQFKARAHSGGRGKTAGKVFLDEGLFLQQTHVGSLYPVMATIPGAQVRIGSSAGLATSEVLRDIRDRGRKGDPGLAYAEWSDQEPPSCQQADCDHHRDVAGCCLDDRDRWRRSNPAMGRRIKESRIATFRRNMPAAEFAREFLGWWDNPGGSEPVLDLAAFGRLEDLASCAVGQLTYGLATSLDRKWSAIAVSGERDDGLDHVDVGEHRPGTGWLVARCVELNVKHGPARFFLDAAGPTASLTPDLTAAGLQVVETSGTDLREACARFVDAVTNKTLRHLGQPDLLAALKAAVWRPVGDGGRAFGRRASADDISCLEAAALAHGGSVADARAAINNVW